MISYLFKNKKTIDKRKLLNDLKETWDLDYIVNNVNNVILGNENIIIDIDPKYISILLYNEETNIMSLKKYLLGKRK